MGFALEELGPERCREIAEGLFEVEKVYGKKLHGFCPIHGDSKSASFVYHYEGDWYKCQSCDAGGDLIKLWCHIHGLDSRGEGFKRFKEEFVGDTAGTNFGARGSNSRPLLRLVETKRKEQPEVFVPEEDLAPLPPLPAERVQQMKRARGWTEEVIRRLDLREFVDFKGNARIAMPIRDEAERLCNIRLYMPGADQFKVISWYDQACKACGGRFKTEKKQKTCSQCGALPNDYGRTRLYPAPSMWKRDGLLWLCEGEPDLICALSQGLNAFTQTAGARTWEESFNSALKGRDVVIAYDADRPGFGGAMKAAQSIAAQAKSVRMILWPELMGGAS